MAQTTETTTDSTKKDIKIVGGEEENNNNLKYLDFVQTRTLQLVGCLSTVYGYAKDNSGPLKPRVQSLEGTVKTVVSPVYDKYHTVPYDLLKFVDQKVDVSVTEGKRRTPTLVGKAVAAAQKAPEVARSVATDVRCDGFVETAKGVAKKAEPTAVSAWHKLNSLPLMPRVTEAVVPRVGYCADKYNEGVCYTVEKGYRAGAYLPLVPTKKIAEVFGVDKAQQIVSVEQ